MSAPGQAEPVTPVPRWVAPFFLVVGIGLVLWTIWIAYDLPRRHVARHWDVAWAGFDVMMAALLLVTAYGAARRAVWLQSAAAASATMLVCDAWFDIVTSGRGADLAMSLASGIFIELPLAVICVWVARNAERAQDYFAAAGGRLTRRRARPR
ncbi:MAG TPA: hypothetical protein VHS27_11595 [Gaiellales bacterium]|nr:hypothetical protein [Gaiellales bacterium]